MQDFKRISLVSILLLRNLFAKDHLGATVLDENKVQAALARAELRDLAEETRRELQDRAQERRKEREEYRKNLEERLHSQLTSGKMFGPRRLLRAFPDSKHARYGEIWKQLSDEINGERNSINEKDAC